MNYQLMHGDSGMYFTSIDQSDHLEHYGVKGMRWGVRRNTYLLRSSDGATRAKAASSLQKHREKGGAEIAKLKKKGAKLEKKHELKIAKSEDKASKMNAKAAKLRRKAYGVFTSADKASERLVKAQLLETKANVLTTRAAQARAKINRNNAMIRAFEREVNNIDMVLVDYGRKYVH